jgi:hypothetical protein
MSWVLLVQLALLRQLGFGGVVVCVSFGFVWSVWCCAILYRGFVTGVASPQSGTGGYIGRVPHGHR